MMCKTECWGGVASFWGFLALGVVLRFSKFGALDLISAWSDVTLGVFWGYCSFVLECLEVWV